MGEQKDERKLIGKYKYFLRTAKNGSIIDDTSSLKGSDQDFIYKHDKTCHHWSGSNPRKYL